jgi:hypothetical protein
MMFAYWGHYKETGKAYNFIEELFFDIGEEVKFSDGIVVIDDYAVEQNISCEEDKLQKADFRVLRRY